MLLVLPLNARDCDMPWEHKLENVFPFLQGLMMLLFSLHSPVALVCQLDSIITALLKLFSNCQWFPCSKIKSFLKLIFSFSLTFLLFLALLSIYLHLCCLILFTTKCWLYSNLYSCFIFFPWGYFTDQPNEVCLILDLDFLFSLCTTFLKQNKQQFKISTFKS